MVTVLSGWETAELNLSTDSCCATEHIAGRDSGEVRVQHNAKLITNTTIADNLPVGGSNRWSSKSFNSNSLLSRNDAADSVGKASSSSAGCFPIMISKATTPKLYTSHFSVTRIVKASSGQHNTTIYVTNLWKPERVADMVIVYEYEYIIELW